MQTESVKRGNSMFQDLTKMLQAAGVEPVNFQENATSKRVIAANLKAYELSWGIDYTGGDDHKGVISIVFCARRDEGGIEKCSRLEVTCQVTNALWRIRMTSTDEAPSEETFTDVQSTPNESLTKFIAAVATYHVMVLDDLKEQEAAMAAAAV